VALSFESEDLSHLDVEGPPRRLNGAMVFGGCALALAVLYWTQAVLIPIALAVLLSFLLSPLVRGFERIRFGRIGSVVVVVVLAFGILGGVGFALFTQVTRFADELPSYRSNIRAKIVDLRGATSGGLIEKVRRAGADVTAAMNRSEPQPAQRGLTNPVADAPVPVVMQSSVLWQIPNLLESLASAGLVLVLVIFMLLERREMRDRLIRLIGYGRLAITTRALDEAAARISRYLLAQSLLNATYGCTVGAGLYLLGVPYALLWGFLASVLRFIPYVGAFLGAAMPVTVSLAAFPGWAVPFKVAGLFAATELVTNMIVEPLAYGQSAGVSQVALLAAVAFWTWLWGPIGLVLATPLTVCVVVLSKNVPELQFIYFLLADEQVLEPDVRLYQRLLAADHEEALEVVMEYRLGNTDSDPYDDLLIPVLVRTSLDRANRRLSGDEEQRMLRAARRLLVKMTGGDATRAAGTELGGDAALLVLGCAAVGPGDALALGILAHKLAADGVALEILWGNAGSLELLSTVEAKRPRAVCIAALPPRGAVAARYLCRRLRRQFADLPIVVLALGGGDDASPVAALRSAGASVVLGSTCAAREALLEIVQPVAEPKVAV
jgi:predicted PurR-regulated permease PerM